MFLRVSNNSSLLHDGSNYIYELPTQEKPVSARTVVQFSCADILNLVYLHSALTVFVQNDSERSFLR